FEKKTSLTDSLKLVGNDPSAAPDLFIFAHDKIGVFAEMGILAPVAELLEENALADYLPMTLDAATYKDTLYQLPLYFETLLFMYNRRYMQDDEVPSTTGELLNYMEQNTGRGRYGFVEQHSTAYYSAAWIHGFGGAIINADGTPFPDTQAVRDALTYHLQFVKLMPGETEYNTVNTLFLEGKADATIGGPWMVPSARDAGIDLGIAPKPTVDETGKPLAPYSGVQGIHVLKFAAEGKTDSVKTLLSALTDPAIGISLALASGCAPANAKCYDDPAVAEDELVQSMRATAEIAVPMPNIPEMDVMWTVVGNLLTDVNLSGKDVGESLNAALSKANELIAAMK
ncbi:MAG: extracellular solute-binding protein, partial [Oscillospiraceae bacterium]|nr:extracellular solute-binding protein [Oscillospiraceae bacterium]